MNHAVSLPSIERPWLKYYQKTDIDAPIPDSTVYEFLVENNHDHPSDTAILYLDAAITYGELFQRIDQCARALLALGVARDDIVTVALPSIPEAVVAFYAINRIGAIANMTHPLANAEDTCRYLNETNCRVLLMFAGNLAVASQVIENTNVEAIVVAGAPPKSDESLKTLKTWEDFILQGSTTHLPPPARSSNDFALISHTSGTTGTQKGVVCTNLNLQAEIFQGLAGIDYQRQECLLATLPPFINYSLVSTILRHLSHGLKVALIPHYQPEKFVEYVQRYHVNHILTIPTYWNAILHIPHIERADLSQLKFLASGGEHMDIKTEKKVNSLLKRCGAKGGLIKGTGMTEMTCATTYSLPWRNPPGSVGSPLVKTNCKIVDTNTGEELTYGQEGEVCFSGPTLMAGYYNNPEATQQVIHTDADGTRWLHTGDLGFLDEDGILFITGRMKRLILTRDDNGMVTKISPYRIEQVIMALPEVEDCCVVGVADEQHIAHLKAFVQPIGGDASQRCQATSDLIIKNGAQKLQSLKDSILQTCRQHLPAYMMPQEVVLLAQLPKTERGKTDYRVLEQMAKQANG